MNLEIIVPPFNDTPCGEADPEDFHPEGPGLAVQHAEARAKMICNGVPDDNIPACPVREACLAWQMAWEAGTGVSSRHGVFGGLNPAERSKLAKKKYAA